MGALGRPRRWGVPIAIASSRPNGDRSPGRGQGHADRDRSEARAPLHSGSVLKAEDLNGSFALVDATVDQVLSTGAFEHAAALFYL